MEQEIFYERQQAHALLDLLTAEKLNVVRSLLEVMVEPSSAESLEQILARAPLADDEVTPDMISSLDRARTSLAEGRYIPHDEVLREFGLVG